MQRAFDVLDEVECQQVVHRRGRQQRILCGSQRRHAVAGLRGDHHAQAAFGNHPAELFQQHRDAVQIDLEDRLDERLRGRHARHLHQRLDLPQFLRLADHGLDRVSIRNIGLHGRGFESRVLEQFGGRVSGFLTVIGEQDMAAAADAVDNRQADAAGADDYGYICPFSSPSGLGSRSFIYVERRITHPAVSVITATARGKLFARHPP